MHSELERELTDCELDAVPEMDIKQRWLTQAEWFPRGKTVPRNCDAHLYCDFQAALEHDEALMDNEIERYNRRNWS